MFPCSLSRCHLPESSSFGNFIKWNYTKFLIAADGTPIKRYGPKAAPLSFEEDIKALLEVTGPCDSSITNCFPEETAATLTDWQTEYESVLKKLEKAHGVAYVGVVDSSRPPRRPTAQPRLAVLQPFQPRRLFAPFLRRLFRQS